MGNTVQRWTSTRGTFVLPRQPHQPHRPHQPSEPRPSEARDTLDSPEDLPVGITLLTLFLNI